jgi:hypothetical protein
MKIDYQNARQLCNAAELSLLEDTKPKSLTKFSEAELKRKISQARKYSDKWRDQAQAQGNSTDGSGARSMQKHELFKEALNRFEARLSRTTVAAKKVPAKAVQKKAAQKKAAKKVSTKKTARKSGKASSPPKAERKGGPIIPLGRKAKQMAIGTESRMATSGLTTRIRGHVSARGRRDQAARSSRKRS